MTHPVDLVDAAKPQNYLILAIFSTLCCCLPTGIAAIVYAAKVDSLWAGGDTVGAEQAAEKARLWSIVSIVAGGLAVVAYSVAVILGMLAAE